MANLIIPDKNKHKYVVGIDFGHGETSAAICPIEWDKDAGQREANCQDIDLDIPARKKVITSAICHTIDGSLIGDEAFDHMSDNDGIRICFKQKPKSLNGKEERLMIDYMRAVYARIRESRDELDDKNHIVYIARPSGWEEEEAKELYRLMAIEAGIPLGGLTSESRAAIFYAKSPQVNFAKEISKGAIVFDLGSSTLDFTYLSDDNKPVDFGYDLGASIIDEVILNKMILCIPKVKEFIDKFPIYRDALKFKARKFKEEVYGRNPKSPTVSGFPLNSIFIDSLEDESFNNFSEIYVPLKIKNLSELNNLIDAETQYSQKIGEALCDFKTHKIPGKPINGVFLTGGASRMNFIRPLISEKLGLPEDKVKRDNDNPSLTISRGIAMLGATDAITSILVSELKSSLPSLVNSESMMLNLIDRLSSKIANSAWVQVETSCKNWVNYGKTTGIDELKEKLKRDMQSFQTYKVSGIVNDTLQTFLKDGGEDIRKKMNQIISRYAPGREIAPIGVVSMDNIDTIKGSLADMESAIAGICDNITNVIADILWVILGAVLWGIFCLPYYIGKAIYNYFRDDKDKRKDKTDKLLKKKADVIAEVQSGLKLKLKDNPSFKRTVKSSLEKYYTNLIDKNLKQVMIPIE